MLRVVLAVGVALRLGRRPQRRRARADTTSCGGCSADRDAVRRGGRVAGLSSREARRAARPVAQVVQPPRARRRGGALALPGSAYRSPLGQRLAAATHRKAGPVRRAGFPVPPAGVRGADGDSGAVPGSTRVRSPTSAAGGRRRGARARRRRPRGRRARRLPPDLAALGRRGSAGSPRSTSSRSARATRRASVSRSAAPARTRTSARTAGSSPS